MLKTLQAGFVCLTMLAFNVYADTGLPEQIRGCSKIADDSERLKCFDALVAGAETRARSNQEARFGKEHKRVTEEAPEAIVATISKFQKTAHKKAYITLDNGQVWKQSDSTQVYWKAGDSVRIERGALNSFFIRKTEGSRRIRVKRVK